MSKRKDKFAEIIEKLCKTSLGTVDIPNSNWFHLTKKKRLVFHHNTDLRCIVVKTTKTDGFVVLDKISTSQTVYTSVNVIEDMCHIRQLTFTSVQSATNALEKILATATKVRRDQIFETKLYGARPHEPKRSQNEL